jgi:EmrB/QacA subfamily drug resistance transporter
MTESDGTELRRTMIVVVFGGLMSMLDATIVNIAIRTLSVRLHVPLSSVQWVVTGYLLALAAVIPVAGWIAARFGPRRVYAWSIAAFTLASAACGLSTSAGELIAFRVIQGAAGALTLPVGSMILARVAGRERMARAMGIIGIPTVLAPVFGPVVGGLLLEHAGWQWIFFVNVPIGLVAVPLALWLLPRDTPSLPGRPDLPGLVLASAGMALATYGLASVGGSADRVVAPVVAGVVLLAAFVIRSARIDRPLLDVRLYANRAYAAASLTTFAMGGAIFGAMILMPLYYQLIRHQDPVLTGLLVAPTGAGAALAMLVSARLTDRFGSGLTALAGGLIAAAATVPFMLIGSSTPYVWLSLSMVARGIGVGLCLVPAMTAAYRAVPPERISDGTVQLNVLNRLGGSVATAVFTVVLQHGLNARVLSVSGSFGTAFRWALGAAVLGSVPAVVLARVESRARARAASASPTSSISLTSLTSPTAPAVPAPPAAPAAPAALAPPAAPALAGDDLGATAKSS